MEIFPAEVHKSTARLEALTDAVFAIAMTLLVLELKLPEAGGGDVLNLGNHLIRLLPNLASFIISFVVLGWYWHAHHTLFQHLKHGSHKLLWLNIFYLLVISLVPFSAALLGRFHAEQIAVVVYSVNMLLAIFIHLLMWRHATRHKQLVEAWVDGRLVHFGSAVSSYAALGYLIAITVSFISNPGALVVLALIPVPFVLGLFFRLLTDD